MSNAIVSKLAALNINAEPHVDDLVKMTMKQFDKLLVISPTSEFKALIPREGRVAILVNVAEVDAAIAANKKAPRNAAKVTITSRMVYEVNAENAVNAVTYAEWVSEDQTGFISVNGTDYPISTGVAADYYEVAEDGNPDRPVFTVTLPVAGDAGEALVLTSYGVTNLIRRVVALNEVIG